MATINITGEQFKSTIRGEGITIVDFWAFHRHSYAPVRSAAKRIDALRLTS